MASLNLKPARTIAVSVLNRFDPKRNYAAAVLNELLQQTDDRQRATDLVFGTVRNMTAIDMVISNFADCTVERIQSKLLNIVRVGVYELLYCTSTEEYAIVNEAVDNAKELAGQKSAGFVNAVLRQVTRRIQHRQIPLLEANIQRTLPQTILSGCEFDCDMLPNPDTCPVGYFSSVFSLPKWLITDWLEEFGFEKTRQVCFASNRRPSVYVRPNRLKITTQELAEKFRRSDVDFEVSADKSLIKINRPRVIAELAGFTEGLFIVQDGTASQPVRLMRPEPGWTILDLCAAPGVKTTQLAELTDDSAKIVATDIDSRRLEKVGENVRRLGLKSVSVVRHEKLEAEALKVGAFDAVLLDVPCSNTGVLSKRAEVRYRITLKGMTKLVAIQSQLLKTAATMVKRGGRICYSTCSIQSCENSRVIRAFLQENHGFELETELLTLPSAAVFDCDGGYVAIIIKK